VEFQIQEVLVAAVHTQQAAAQEIPRIEVHPKVTTEELEIAECLIMAVEGAVVQTQ
jgi:hypothetical protein